MIREAKSRLAEATAAAARGDRIVVTQRGRPFIELVPAQRSSGMDFEKDATVRQALRLDGVTVTIDPEFDDPAFSRRVLGIDD